MPDVVCTLVRHVEPEGRRHQLADVVERAGTDCAHERLQFGERLFDRIEVRAVGRKKSQARARLRNRDVNLGLFVGGEIVEYDDIAMAERGHEDLLDVGAERGVVDRAIEHGRCRQFRGAERRDHGMCLPMAAGRVIRDARAARAAGVAT